jgi:hypothetical protein
MDPAMASLVISSVNAAANSAAQEAGKQAWQGLTALVRRARRSGRRVAGIRFLRHQARNEATEARRWFQVPGAAVPHSSVSASAASSSVTVPNSRCGPICSAHLSSAVA